MSFPSLHRAFNIPAEKNETRRLQLLEKRSLLHGQSPFPFTPSSSNSPSIPVSTPLCSAALQAAVSGSTHYPRILAFRVSHPASRRKSSLPASKYTILRNQIVAEDPGTSSAKHLKSPASVTPDPTQGLPQLHPLHRSLHKNLTVLLTKQHHRSTLSLVRVFRRNPSSAESSPCNGAKSITRSPYRSYAVFLTDLLQNPHSPSKKSTHAMRQQPSLSHHSAATEVFHPSLWVAFLYPAWKQSHSPPSTWNASGEAASSRPFTDAKLPEAGNSLSVRHGK